MYQKFGNITNNNEKFNYIYCDTHGLLLFLINNKIYKKSFIKILKEHRSNNNEIINLVIENYNHEKRKDKLNYLLIYNKKEIICTSRISINKIGLIQFVHTKTKYQNRKLCQQNVKKIMSLTNKYLKINKFQIGVSKTNKPAIKCYLNCKFKIIKQKYINDKYYLMQYIIKN